MKLPPFRFIPYLLLMLFFQNGVANEPAPWISYPSANVRDYGVYHFRKVVQIDEKPQTLLVRLSADLRYKLYVNASEVSYGPAKGDLQTWKYDVVDIAPYLHRGENVLGALVFHFGKDKNMSMQSAQTAFFLQAEESSWSFLNTDDSWKVYQNPSYQPVSYQEMLRDEPWFRGYYACGPGDRLDTNGFPWAWNEIDFDDGNWKPAELLQFHGSERPWNLMENPLPSMKGTEVLPVTVRKCSGTAFPVDFLKEDGIWVIPANTSATIILDYGVLTMGYPDLTVRGGSNSVVKVNYAEALYEKVNLKGHRDQVDGLTMYGVWDEFKTDGGARTFRPLWKRCFRYVQLVVETKEEPLEILSHKTEYSGYPYPEMATFESDDGRINEIFEICLRTLQMCSAETYYDTPFYEQLSYGGDNRPIASNSVYNSTDDRLLREVLRLYPQSANEQTGLMASAYPADWELTQGTWSLAWIQTLRDYYQYRGDVAFLKPFVPSIEKVLGYYERHLNEAKGILGAIPVQNFMDWSIRDGSLPRRINGNYSESAMLTMFFLHTLDATTELYQALDESEKSEKWRMLADAIRLSCREQYWDAEAKLFRDQPDQNSYSQHANILAILTDVAPVDQQKELLSRILESRKFEEYASSYFSFFLFKAMGKVGMEDEFLNHLDFWYQFIKKGFTTAGETGFASHDRSDCHAWAAHPSYFLLSYVCGIQPGSVGFETVRITPHPGHLKSIKASMPHRKGRIHVEYEVDGEGALKGTITLPEGLHGTFVNETETEIMLHPGMNRID